MKRFFQGYIPSTNPELDTVNDALGRHQGSPEFGDVAPHLKGKGAGRLSTPYKSVLRFAPKSFTDEAQTTGDCTSHGTRNAHDISRAVEIDVKGEPESWEARGATEPIYGNRGHSGAGMSPARATMWCHEYGIMIRKDYGFVDLSEYDSRIGARWGRSGPPTPVRETAAEHPCKYYARIRNVEELRDALAAGMGAHVGSQYGNDGKRDSNGVARWNASWNHDMCVGAADETGDDLYFLVINSWGIWNDGGHPEGGPIPGGAFLVPSRDMSRMIASGECWVVGDVTGYPARDLPDYGAAAFL